MKFLPKRSYVLFSIFILTLLIILSGYFFVAHTTATTSNNYSSGNWNATSTWSSVHLLQSISTGQSANYGTYDGTNFWIGNFSGNAIYKISNGATSSVTYGLGGSINPLQLAWDGTYIWVGSADTYGQLIKFDPVSETIVATYTMNPTGLGNGGVQGVLWDGTYIWVGVAQSLGGPGSGLVLKVDPSNGNVIGTSTGQMNVNGLVSNGAYIWAANDGFISKINKADMTYATTSAGISTYRLATDGTYIYGADFFEDTVRKFLASDMSLVATWPSGHRLNTIAYDGTNLWVAGDDDQITVHDKNTGDVLYTLANAARTDLVWDGTYMWGNLIGVVNKFTISSLFSNGWPVSIDNATVSTGTVTLVGNESVNNLTISAGTLNLNGNTLTVFGDLAISGGTLNINSGTINVTGNLTIGGGTLDFASSPLSTVNLNGNWTYASGTVLSNQGTVNFISTTTQSILGANTFGNLVKVATSSTSSLLFDPSGTTTVTNSLTLNGVFGNVLSLATTGASPSQFISKFGSSGSGDGQLSAPLGIHIDSSGYIYM